MSTELTAPDVVSRTLARFRPAEILDVMGGLKTHADSNPAQVRAVLEQNPDLTYAVLQTLFLMGLVDDRVIADAMKASHVGGSQQQVAPATTTTPEVVSTRQESPTVSSTSGAAAPVASSTTSSGSTDTALDEKLASLDPQQQAMIRQILQLTEDQIAALPAEHQQQVRAVRSIYQ